MPHPFNNLVGGDPDVRHEQGNRVTKPSRRSCVLCVEPKYADRMIDRRRFEELVAEALDSLPRWVLKRLENVEVLVEERPPQGEPNLLGRYHGIPLTKRSNYSGVLPDTITLYRSTVQRSARNEDELRKVIAHTVEHEVAHFFGISDERLRDLGAY